MAHFAADIERVSPHNENRTNPAQGFDKYVHWLKFLQN